MGIGKRAYHLNTSSIKQLWTEARELAPIVHHKQTKLRERERDKGSDRCSVDANDVARLLINFNFSDIHIERYIRTLTACAII